MAASDRDDARRRASETRKHINAVLRSSRAQKGAWAVLEALCRLAEFDRPEVTATKADLVTEARRSWKTIKLALSELREEGTIIPVRNKLGGRGNAVTYRLCIAAGAAAAAPEPVAEAAEVNALWARIAAEIERTDPANYRAWVARLSFVTADGGLLVVNAPSRFIASHVKTHLEGRLIEAAAAFDPAIRRLEVAAA